MKNMPYKNIIEVSEVFYNENGDKYTILYVNKEKDRTLLLNDFGHYVGAWGIMPEKGCWCQGHYFMEDLEAAVAWVMGKE